MSKTLYDTFPKEEVLFLYGKEKMPICKIAKKFGVSHKTMKKFFKKNNIDIRGRISANKFIKDKEWLNDQYINKEKSITYIAKIAGTSRGNVYSALKFALIPIRGVSEGIKVSRPDMTGKNHPRWKNGKRLTGENGRYLEIKCPGHPNANGDGYILEQRLVMSEYLGRPLTQGEIIHHKDGDGHNNDISNLELTTKKKHFNDHFDAVKEVSRLKKILNENNISY